MVTVDTRKKLAAPRGAASHRGRKTRLIDLNGAKLYAIISYRLAMAIIVAVTILEMGRQGS